MCTGEILNRQSAANSIRRIGVISDTHLRRVSKEFEAIYERYLSDKDLILHAGDVLSTEMVDFLSRKNFHGVHGNMDPIDVRNLLPNKKIIRVGPYRLGLIHGWGSSDGLEDRIWSQFHNVDAIVYGHSHKTANHVREGVLLFNPGTATGFSSTNTHTIGVLEVNDGIHGEIIRL